jgi:glutamate dehydrogenase
MTGATSANAAAVTAAYAAARDAYGLTELNRLLDGLDGVVPAATQLSLYGEVTALLRAQTLWFLRNETFEAGLSELVARYALGVGDLRTGLAAMLPASLAISIASRTANLVAEGVPMELARRFAELPTLALASDIVLVATRTGSPVLDTAAALLQVVETFGLVRVVDGASAIVATDRFDRMALDRALANLFRAERDLATDVLSSGDGPIDERFATWRAAHTDAIDRAAKAVAELTEGSVTVSRLSVAAGLLSDLARQT